MPRADHMPQSLILNLTAQSAIPPKHLQGYSLQQLFINLVEIVDPELGRVLRRDKENYSYSLSAIQSDIKREANTLHFSHSNTLSAQTECWWRISFLDDALLDHLVYLWNQIRDEIFQLGSSSVKVVRITTGSHYAVHADSCSYQDIYEQASDDERDIHLRFLTPTAFKHSDAIIPLPTAEAVFHPLRKHWNRYSGLAFTPSLIESITPTHFDIQTSSIQTIRRQSQQTITGCTGRISFRIGNKADPLIIKRINTLADFTQYCGVGFNSRLGMGIVQRLKAAALQQQRKIN